MKISPWIILAAIGLLACGTSSKEAKTPEEAVERFCKWAKRGMDTGMKLYAKKDYVQNVINGYGGLALLSEVYPTDIMIIETKKENGKTFVSAEAKDILGNHLKANFEVAIAEGKWMVQDGWWRGGGDYDETNDEYEYDEAYEDY